MIEMKTTTRIKRSMCVKVTGQELIQLLNQELKAKGSAMRVPDDAKVEFFVPGGGDYSNCALDVDLRNPITVEWTEIEDEANAQD